MRLLASLAFAIASAAGLPAAAQDAPGRVGRLAYAEGPVSVYQDPDIGWEKAYVNSPVTSENSVWTDRGARAELRVAGTSIRLDHTTQLDLARLDDDDIDALVVRGSVAVRVRYKQRNERIAFATPHARFLLEADGRYRIDVDSERDESRLTVFSGAARMESQRGRVRVEAGQSIVLWGYPSPSYAFEDANADGFDRWALARDEQWRDSRARRYVSTYMTGYEDLDRYGEWVEEPDYGALWFPTRVSSGWAPYRHGHWGYVRPWGWTWIDDEPWGYAPSHYGRWVYVRDRWGWTPGRRIDRPVWAPALVAWVGGSNWSVGVGSGSPDVVGWYPLSPWERYEPWYRSNRSYLDRVNVNVVARDHPPRQWEGRGDWRTWNRDRGATVVQRDTIIDRRPVGNALVHVAPEQLRNQPVVTPTQVLPARDAMVRRRAETPQPAAPAPAPTVMGRPTASGAPAGAPSAPGAPATATAPGQPANAAVARPDFGRRAMPPAAAPAPAPANQAPPSAFVRRQPGAPAESPAGRAQSPQGEQRQREAQQQQQQQQQQQERAQREAQQQQQERAQREAQQQQERAQREAQQQQQQRTREAQQQQERAAREAQQQQERAQREAQQQQQERAAREAQQQQQQRAREAQQQQERAQREAQQQQERVQREAQQQQERAQREAQQRAAQEAQQRAAQEAQQRAAREAQQQQERAAREAQQQQLRAREAQQLQERAAREAQQAQERAAREAQQLQQRAAQEAQRAAREAQPPRGEREKEKGKDKEKAKEKEKEKEKDDKDKEKDKQK